MLLLSQIERVFCQGIRTLRRQTLQELGGRCLVSESIAFEGFVLWCCFMIRRLQLFHFQI